MGTRVRHTVFLVGLISAACASTPGASKPLPHGVALFFGSAGAHRLAFVVMDAYGRPPDVEFPQRTIHYQHPIIEVISDERPFDQVLHALMDTGHAVRLDDHGSGGGVRNTGTKHLLVQALWRREYAGDLDEWINRVGRLTPQASADIEFILGDTGEDNRAMVRRDIRAQHLYRCAEPGCSQLQWEPMISRYEMEFDVKKGPTTLVYVEALQGDCCWIVLDMQGPLDEHGHSITSLAD